MNNCGCGKHKIDLTAKVVDFDGKEWDAICAFSQMKNLLEKVDCPLCNRPVGKNYKFFGNNLYHKKCLYDLGGES